MGACTCTARKKGDILSSGPSSKSRPVRHARIATLEAMCIFRDVEGGKRSSVPNANGSSSDAGCYSAAEEMKVGKRRRHRKENMSQKTEAQRLETQQEKKCQRSPPSPTAGPVAGVEGRQEKETKNHVENRNVVQRGRRHSARRREMQRC